MKELELKYGCNPNQKPSRIYMENGELPIKVLNGKPENWGMVLDINMHMIIRIIMWSSNICRTD